MGMMFAETTDTHTYLKEHKDFHISAADQNTVSATIWSTRFLRGICSYPYKMYGGGTIA